MLRVMKNFRDGGKDYKPGDPAPEMDAHDTEKLRRLGWLGEGTVGARPVKLEVKENPPDTNWIQIG